jgi:hypothetical protein
VTGRHVLLWGGPEDGAVVWVDGGDLPARIGTARTAGGALVPIRSRALLASPDAGHVQVYERATAAIRERMLAHAGGRLDVSLSGHLYVHRDLVTRWAAQAP